MSGNQLTVEALNSQRRQAVQLRLEGHTLRAVKQATQLSAPTIISAVKAFKTGGWAAVTVNPRRGRPAAQTSAFGPALELALLRHMLSGDGPAAWNVNQVVLWFKEHGLVVGRTGILQWCRRIGLYLPDQTLPPGLPGHKCHRLRSFTLRLDPGHYQALGCRPVSRVAIDSRGAIHWRLHASDALQASDHLALWRPLVDASHKPTTLLLAGASTLQRLPEIAAWLQQRSGSVALQEPEGTDATDTPARPTTRHPLLSPQSSESPPMTLTHLQRLEAESIHIMREVVAETDNPVMLYSIGKDSAVMLHLAMKAFYPSKPPFKLLHVDTRWKFREMYAFRDRMARELGLELLVHINPDGIEKDINPFTHGSAIHTDIMKTEGLKQALDLYGFDAAFGGARRDEEKSRAKERIFSFRSDQHRWDPKNQRPELWKLYNARKHKGESIRVFPISNWTELDIWQYIYLQNIPIVPLYYAAERPVVRRDGTLIMVDDDRMPLKPGEVPMMKKVRFRTLGCYPLTGAVESEAATLPEIIQEMLLTSTSERQGRVIDHDSAASMEKKKQEGYF
ncbi:sulfate adenylyltransferase subunit CysD [Hydrogenophaga aromaticivorans]|nr:sulfate adenylyltransferase subunit CysD [Hydrogenophaga aromaticivorans]